MAETLIETYSSQVRIGKLLTEAQDMVAESDTQLEEANRQRDELEGLLKEAQSLVKARDSQLEFRQESLNQAESLVKERDRQLNELDSAYISLQKATHDLREAHETLYQGLRSNLVGKLALRLISSRSDESSNE